jgi:hypothetical protein
MNKLIALSIRMKGRMPWAFSLAMIFALLAFPLLRSGAQDSRGRDYQRREGREVSFTPNGLPGELIYATSGNDIARFFSGATGVVTSVPVTGLQAGESLVGIDIRTATGQLYGISTTSRLYTIVPLTGAATPVGAAGAFTLNGTSFAMDFNPVVDRIRLISNTGQNLRINPNDGTLAGTDTAISPAGVTITGAAYDRNDRNAATGTTLYAIDSTNGVLTTVGSINGSPNSPNSGLVGPTVGSLGLGTALDPRIGFDISAIGGTAYATMLTGGTDKLYQINLSTGQATLLGTIGTGTSIYAGMTVANILTAGEVSLAGRVTSSEGRGITNVRVTVTGASLAEPISIVTGRSGQYVIEGLTAGETYVVSVSSRRFVFDVSSQVVTLNDNLSGVDFQSSTDSRSR